MRARADRRDRSYFFSGLLWGELAWKLDFAQLTVRAATFFLAMVRFIGFLYYLTGESIFRAARLCARARK